jgi:hypothetical protein
MQNSDMNVLYLDDAHPERPGMQSAPLDWTELPEMQTIHEVHGLPTFANMNIWIKDPIFFW